MILARKNYQNILIFMIFARKINKIPKFYMIFLPENARILHNNCPEIFSRILGKHVPPAPLSYAYVFSLSSLPLKIQLGGPGNRFKLPERVPEEPVC